MKKIGTNCPRCRTKRSMRIHLDGSKSCKKCGQRIASNNSLLPSADKRKTKIEEKQLFLI